MDQTITVGKLVYSISFETDEEDIFAVITRSHVEEARPNLILKLFTYGRWKAESPDLKVEHGGTNWGVLKRVKDIEYVHGDDTLGKKSMLSLRFRAVFGETELIMERSPLGRLILKAREEYSKKKGTNE